MNTNAPPIAPVVLPLVEVRISEDGTADVTVNNTSYDAATTVGRDRVERVIREIAASLGPVRVRVTESDESTYTDVVMPTSASDGQDSPAQPRPGLSGSGFLPDEQVDVAVIVARRTADANGRALLCLPPAALTGRSGTLVLLGRASGTFTICEST